MYTSVNTLPQNRIKKQDFIKVNSILELSLICLKIHFFFPVVFFFSPFILNPSDLLLIFMRVSDTSQSRMQ